MAAKENQGLQAIIIVLAILVLGLGVGLLLVNNARKTAAARATDSENRATQANNEKSQLQAETSAYKSWMGFPEGESKTALDDAFKKDMDRFGANVPEESRKYRAILENIFEENRKLVLNEANAKAEVKSLKDSLLAVEAQKEEQVKKFSAEMKKVAADAAAEKAKFNDQYAAINTDKAEVAKQLQEKQVELDDLKSKLSSQRGEYDAKTVKLERSIEKLRQGLPEVDQFAQPADGSITWVNQKYRTVWINLGSDDGLRPQVTFSVASAGLGDAESAEKKGSIEVVRIIGPHQAEASITLDDPTNPLIPGDRIFSQVWDRGRKVGFGIAGFIDINGDRKSDLDQLKDIIIASNGRVDASPDATGKKEGELKIDTRYLVLGEFPDDPRRVEYRNSWTELSEQAEELGIQTIPLTEFLKLMGWKSESRTVNLGAGARPEDFPAEPLGEQLPRKHVEPSGVFKKRLPPITY